MKKPRIMLKLCAKAKEKKAFLACCKVTFYSYKETYYFLQCKDGLKTIYSSSPSYLQCYMKAKQSSLLDGSLELTESQGAAGDGLLPSITAL